MKNFLLGLLNFLLGLLINALYMYVVLPILLIGILAWLWLPIVFDISNCFGGVGLGLVIGIVISILTLVVAEIVECKLESY